MQGDSWPNWGRTALPAGRAPAKAHGEGGGPVRNAEEVGVLEHRTPDRQR